ncbi:putative Transglutaminase-like cysteine protease [Hyphomicrobiales bacterium]|nr:putative Transglutaminase-like cysteine protease [Hyphomicrobiales bacterium]CAH1697597.1 putative Transglutaminase-like cysteine protease [Hyphomicrobiales bacterium]CAI0347244.1 putative Transglutaminase-like cysteine protease [Hyphomicrobiales bacterium]
MDIRIGYRIEIVTQQPTPGLLLLDPHPIRDTSIVSPPTPQISSLVDGAHVPVREYIDRFGNRCRRLIIPQGGARFTNGMVLRDPGTPDQVDEAAAEVWPADLPDEVIEYTLSSRYCEVDELSPTAWSLFGNCAPGWNRVQQICNFVHAQLRFDYQFARSTRSAAQAMNERVGVCRDFTHLAIALCRCMNIPARYCNGFLGDIGVPPDPAPMDYNAWFEAYLGGRWYTFDARHNTPRIGRILVARGRDAADIPMIHTFGPHMLQRFEIYTDELKASAA